MSGYDRYARGSDTYDPGDYYVVCDYCEFKIRRSQARKTWDGLIVCPRDFEERQPQDFVRGVRNRIAAPDPNPEPPDTFIPPNHVQPDDL